MIWARLRSWTGLVIAAFVLLHLLNHSAGIFSVQLMDELRYLNAALWQSLPGTVVLYAALLAHIMVALRTLYVRRTLRIAKWQLLQLALGIAVPMMLIGHVVGTRVNQELNGFDVDYSYVLTILWSNDWLRIKQVVLVLAVWLHLCLGLHYWLRNLRGYAKVQPVLFALAVLIPCLALLGFARGSLEVQSAMAQGTLHWLARSFPAGAARPSRAGRPLSTSWLGAHGHTQAW